MQPKEFDVVRITSKVPAGRVDPNIGDAAMPQIGDIGTIVFVHTVQPKQEAAFLVECTGPKGNTRWLADILCSELELASTNCQRRI